MADASNPRTGTSHKRVGSVVRGKYRVETFLATGTMGNVYAATHRNGARVALKILHKQLAEDPALCERFKREGYFANSIGHPGIVRAIDDDVTEDGCPFLVMELLEGETIEERRRRKGGKLHLSWLLPVADSLLDILTAAHAHNVVHRDLKPDNVFVTRSGEVKVLDFGVARWNDGKSSSDMTGVGMVLGTPAYMPPEQALGRREDVDAQSDLWAVGATLFVALSGESVHVGGDAKAKLIATARTAARPLREAAPEVPRSVAAVIDRALAFHKKERWPDAQAMREALRWARMSLEDRPSQQLAASSEPDVDPVPPPTPTKRTMDSEPTVLRARVADDDEIGETTRSVPPNFAETLRDHAPQSPEFVTSAPPITLRDLRAAPSADPSSPDAALSHPSEPVFSLRREKDVAPSTERIPTGDDRGNELDDERDDARGATAIMRADRPGGAEGHARGLDMNLSFTRPVASMVMPPGLDAPRPGAGAPSPSYAPPRGQPSARPSLPPESPGPLLSQIVKPRLNALRLVVPIVLGVVATLAVFVMLRSRAANAQHETATMAPPSSDSTASAAASAAADAAAEASALPAIPSSSVANLPDADPKHGAGGAQATGTGGGTAAGAGSADPKKAARPRRPRKPAVVKPGDVSAAEAASGAGSGSGSGTAAADPAPGSGSPAPLPLDITPKAPPPSEDPDPPRSVPAPADPAAP